VLIIAFLALLLTIYTYDKSELEFLISNTKSEKDTLLYKAVNVKSSSLTSFAYDYSYWDDLIDFIKTRKTDWAYKNIDIVLPTYNCNATWVYDDKFQKIYSSSQNDSLGLVEFPLSREELIKIFEKNKFPHFFLETKKGLFEIAGGPVQPTGDAQRMSKAQGYFIAGRLWTNDYLKQISEITSSNMTLLAKDDKQDTVIKDFKINNYISLKDQNGITLKVLQSTTNNDYFRNIVGDTKKIQLIIIFSVSMILLLIFLFFFYFVNRPLIAIEKTLSSEDTKHINELAKSQSEFGNIANLIQHSFEQKDKILEEVEARKETEERLKEAKEKAEESNRMKSLFLANMSHEFRTPLTAVIGFSEILKNEINNDSQIKILAYIEDASKRLMTTLNSILELAQLETTDYKSNFRNINVAFEINSAYSNFKYKTSKKNLELITDFKDDTLEVIADDKMLSLIITNILDNACKFTEKGFVKITLEKVTEGSDGFVHLKVEDTGIGIANDKLDIIFEEFRQASEGYNRVYEGSGLGLTIAKRMVEFLNGRITVKSELGKGSEFSVYLPLAPKSHNEISLLIQEQKEDEMIAEINRGGAMPKVLLVEDNEANIQLIKITLMDLCEVDFSYTAEEALEMAGRIKYDAVLMDLNLGAGLNGIEAAKRIREIDGYKNVKIIAVTGYATMRIKEDLLKNDFDGFVSKPFSSREITTVIKNNLYKL
jgi:signal transduction histidine kinase/CheY-like chemotaxis protein